MRTRTLRWNQFIFAALVAGSQAAAASDSRTSVCPDEHDDNPMQTVLVFDGPPEDKASLIPERDRQGTYYWNLDTVYADNRHVWVQCNYKSKLQRFVELSTPVKRCTFEFRREGTHRLWCTPAVEPVVRP